MYARGVLSQKISDKLLLQAARSAPEHFGDDEDEDGASEAAAKKEVDQRISDGRNR